jgi:hypothetical protein
LAWLQGIGCSYLGTPLGNRLFRPAPFELEVHHLIDAATRPDLAARDENLLVISSELYRNIHSWLLGIRSCKSNDLDRSSQGTS